MEIRYSKPTNLVDADAVVQYLDAVLPYIEDEDRINEVAARPMSGMPQGAHTSAYLDWEGRRRYAIRLFVRSLRDSQNKIGSIVRSNAPLLRALQSGMSGDEIKGGVSDE